MPKTETDNQIKDDFSTPFEKNVDEKTYAANNGSHAGSNGIIPEPTFMPPSFDEKTDFFDQIDSGKKEKPANGNYQNRQTNIPNSQSHNTVSDFVNEIDDKDKRRAAESLASTILEGYVILWKKASEWVMIKPQRVSKLIREGKIDPDSLYYAPGNVLATAPQIIDAFNEEMGEMLIVSNDFIEKVRPPLIRVLIKRGLGMSDESLLIYYFGQDIILKGTAIFSIKKQGNDFLRSFSQNKTNAPLPDNSSKTVQTTNSDLENNDNLQDVSNTVVNNAAKEVFRDEHKETLNDSAPENFFKDSEREGRLKVPDFGSKEKLDGIKAIAEMDSVVMNTPTKKRGRPKGSKKVIK